jgi:hypothetical protein
MSYNCHDADEEFLEINDFFDLDDVEQSMNCKATEHLISSTNVMFENAEYSDATLLIPGHFDTADMVAENQFVDFGTTEVRTQSQIALNVQSHRKHNHVVLSSHTSGT